MARQYQRFQPIILTRDLTGPVAIGPMQGLGSDLAIYRDPEGSGELFTKEEFLFRFRFEPSEEYQNEAPEYTVQKDDAQRGDMALPYIDPELVAKVEASSLVPTRKYEAEKQAGIRLELPLEPLFPKYPPSRLPPKWDENPPEFKVPEVTLFPPLFPPKYPPKLPPNGKPPVMKPPWLPPQEPPREPPREPPDGVPCCLPVRICCPEEMKMQTYPPPGGSSAVAYGGQSIVQIGSPGASALAPQGGSAGGPDGLGPTYGYAGPSEFDVTETGGGLLDLITPKSREDWIKLAAGFVVGLLIGRAMKKSKKGEA